MWRRIGILAFTWGLLISLGELTFIGWYRVNGSGRHNYDVTFADEQYVRSHLGEPCSFHLGNSCSPQMLAMLHHQTTVDFWLDVRDNSLPVILRLITLLVVCILSMIAWELWQRHRHTLK